MLCAAWIFGGERLGYAERPPGGIARPRHRADLRQHGQAICVAQPLRAVGIAAKFMKFTVAAGVSRFGCRNESEAKNRASASQPRLN
jgi:hypothetical protein